MIPHYYHTEAASAFASVRCLRLTPSLESCASVAATSVRQKMAFAFSSVRMIVVIAVKRCRDILRSSVGAASVRCAYGGVHKEIGVVLRPKMAGLIWMPAWSM
jgi:hypothetical protein